MPNPSLMWEMTWPEVNRCIEEHTPIALIVGATEQHGPHLPLGTDVICPYEVLKRVAGMVPLVLAPPITYGYKSRPLSGGGQGFVGTTSLSAATLIGLVRDIVGEFLRHGWTRIVVVQDHLENQNFVFEGIDLAVRDRGAGQSKIVLVEDWLAELSAAELEILFPEGFPGAAVEHASVLETSAMLALRPDLVRQELIADDAAAYRPEGYDLIPPPPEITTRSGVLSRASQGSAEKGELLVREGVRFFLALFEREFGITIQGGRRDWPGGGRAVLRRGGNGRTGRVQAIEPDRVFVEHRRRRALGLGEAHEILAHEFAQHRAQVPANLVRAQPVQLRKQVGVAAVGDLGERCQLEERAQPVRHVGMGIEQLERDVDMDGREGVGQPAGLRRPLPAAVQQDDRGTAQCIILEQILEQQRIAAISC